MVAGQQQGGLQLGFGWAGPRPAELVDIAVLVSGPEPRSASRGSRPGIAAARSVRFTTGAIRVEADRHHVTLPRLGTIRTHESTRKLARRLEAGTARILSATVRCTGGRWQCAFQVIVAGKTRPGHAGRSATSGWWVSTPGSRICWWSPPPTGRRSTASRRRNR